MSRGESWGKLTRFSATALAMPLFGCATDKVDSTSASPRDASAAGDTGPEQRRIRLTLPPLYDYQDDENGFGDPISVGGAEICVLRARPWGAAWSDFLETNGPCATTVADVPTVLEGVPGVSELIVTAHKDGYWPSVFPVTTDRRRRQS